MRHSRGFTLIELMIVVSIIAILSAIAIPAYSEYIKRSNITEAVSTLSSMRVKMEQIFQDDRTYANACTAASAGVTVANLPPSTTNFDFSCPSHDASSYQILATGKSTGPMSSFVYSLSQSSTTGAVRATTGVPTGWTTSSSCWVLKKDGSC